MIEYPMNIDIPSLKALIALLDEAQLTELEVREGDQTIRVARALTALSPVVSTPTSSVVPTEVTQTAEEVIGHKINSPMVGIFYHAPSPEAKPFVEVGQTVKAGQVLCIIEAMKMMNQVEADRAGVIKARLVENAQPVEFGQALFVIE